MIVKIEHENGMEYYSDEGKMLIQKDTGLLVSRAFDDKLGKQHEYEEVDA